MKTKNKQLKLSQKDDSTETWWQELYRKTEDWQSELQFFSDEIIFFRDLLEKHFQKITEPKFHEKSKAVILRINSVEATSKKMGKNLHDHLKHIQNLIENPFPHDSTKYQDEHKQLKSGIRQLEIDFRVVKKELFTLVDSLLKSEKSSHLIG